MAPASRLYLDSNIFIRIFEGTDEDALGLSRLLTVSAPPEQRIFTSELTLAEVLVRPYATANKSLTLAYDNWLKNGPLLRVINVDRSVLQSAARLRADHKSLKLPDAIHVSGALLVECTHFLSADNRIAGRYVLSPGERERGDLEVIRPSASVVEQLVKELE